MASISNDQTVVDACDSTSGWALTGTGSLSAVGGPRREGTNCFRYTSSATQTSFIEKTTFSFDLTGECLMVWMAANEARTLGNVDDIWIRIGSASGDWKEWRMDGLVERRLFYANWYRYCIDPLSSSTSSTAGTLDITAVDRIRVSMKDNGDKSSVAIIIDYFSRGAPKITADTTGLIEGTAYAFTDLIDEAESTDGGTVMEALQNGGIGIQGQVAITGTGWFKEVNKSVIFVDNTRVHQVDSGQLIEITAAATFQLGNLSGGIGIDGCVLRSQNTIRWRFTANHASATINLYGCSFGVMDVFEVLAGSVTVTDGVISDCTTIDLLSSADDFDRISFVQCGEVTPNGAQMDDCSFIAGSTEYQMIVDVAADIANVTNPSFINGDNAIKITAAGTYEFDNHTYSGNTFDVETTHSSGVVTINVNNGGDVPSTNAAGSGTIVVNNTVTVKTTTKESVDLTVVENMRILLEADGSDDLPARESVTIARSGSTASVAHTSHGMLDGQEVTIRGANEPEYNIRAAITNVTTNAYDYTVSGTPDSPATGTITSTAVILDALSDASGIVQDTSFNFTADQAVIGTARKATSSPRYKTSKISGTITSAGLDATVVVVLNE
jgi:hypothetical protein